MNRVSQWVRDRLAKHIESETHIDSLERDAWNSNTDDSVVNQHISNDAIHVELDYKLDLDNKLNGSLGASNANVFIKTDDGGNITKFESLQDDDIPPTIFLGSDWSSHIDGGVHVSSEDKMEWGDNIIDFMDGMAFASTNLNSLFKGRNTMIRFPLFDTSEVTDFKDMCSGCVALKSVPPLDFTNCEDMWGAFDGCSSLTSLALNVAKCSLDIQDTGIVGAELNALYESLDTVVAYQGITVSQAQYDDAIANKSIATGKGWRVHVPLIDYSIYFYNDKTIINGPMLDTSKGTDFRSMFQSCSNLTTIPLIDTSKGTNFRSMFQSCSNLTTIPLIDTSKGTYFSNMFSVCTKLTTIPLLNTSKGTYFSGMFHSCGKLTTIPLLNTSKATDFSQMFYSCTKLTTIPLLNTSIGTDFSNMFSSCTNLTTIPLIDTSKGTNFSYMFYNCSKLTTIPSIDTSKGTDFRSMFQSCSNLTTIPLIDTSEGTNFSFMFYSCSKLESAQLSGCTRSVDISPTIINGANLDAFYTALGTAFDATQKITVNATQLASGDASIATAKGWVVGL